MRRRSLWLLRHYIRCKEGRLRWYPGPLGQPCAQGALCSRGSGHARACKLFWDLLHPSQELGAELAPSPLGPPNRCARWQPALPRALQQTPVPRISITSAGLQPTLSPLRQEPAGGQTAGAWAQLPASQETPRRSNSSIFIDQFITSKSTWGRGSSSRQALLPAAWMRCASSAPDKLLGCSQESKLALPHASFPLCSHSSTAAR